MRRGVTPNIGVLLATAVLGAGTAWAAVGGPPTNDTIGCQPDQESCSPSTVIWERAYFNGPTEVVAFTAESSICTGFDYLGRPDIGGSFGCGSVKIPRGQVGEIHTWGYARPIDHKAGQVSNLTGTVVPQAARVVVRYRKANGSSHERTAKVVRISGEMQQRLQLDRPLSMFLLSVRGKVPFPSFSPVVYDADGRRLAKIPGFH
jgi:hypothetical protein